jgi:hypothetical protein
MPLDRQELFRDCPWCGLRDAQFRALSKQVAAGRASATPRYWAFISCPRCGGFVALETGHPTATPDKAIGQYPASDRELGVRHLPPDVADYYRDAIRVLVAGGP